MKSHVRQIKSQFPDIEFYRTKGDHMYTLVNGRKIYMSSTPSDRRSVLNIISSIKRAKKLKTN